MSDGDLRLADVSTSALDKEKALDGHDSASAHDPFRGPQDKSSHEAENRNKNRLTADIIERGGTFIPLNVKRPIPEKWQTFTRRDAAARAAIMGSYSGNRGLVTGPNRIEMPDGSWRGVIVIDEDNKPVRPGEDGKLLPAKNGRATIEELERRIGVDLPLTLTARTASGEGRHHYFDASDVPDISPRVFDKILGRPSNVDFMNDGEQVVFNGSVITEEQAAAKPGDIAGDYAWIDRSVPVATLPKAWRDMLVLHNPVIMSSEPGANAPVPIDVDLHTGNALNPLSQWRIDKSIDYCLSTEYVAVKGAGGERACMQVALHLVRNLLLPLDLAEILMVELWSKRCTPPSAWRPEKLRKKLEDARDKGQFEPDIRESYAPVTEPLVEERIQKRAIILGTDLHRVVNDAARSLEDHPHLYQRSGRLVRVVKLGDTRSKALTTEGTLTVLPLSEASLKTELTLVGDWKRQTSKGDKAANPPPDVVNALQERGYWPVRELAGIVETPALRPDGTILQTPGYDEATRFYFDPGVTTFPLVSDAPTREDATRALAELSEVFDDFPYVDAGISVPIAAILTLLARPAIKGSVPAFLFDASTRGAGKSLQAECVGLIATGRPVSQVIYPSNDDETAKILAGYATKGVSLFSWDNITCGAGFGGAPLDAVLTKGGGPVDFRMLGKTGQPTFTWWAVMLGTGNNISFRGDTSRRALVARLEPNCENPENRTDAKHQERWGEHKLQTWVKANRPRLVVAGLTVLRAYVAAGRPVVPEVKLWGSFGAWSSLVAQAIVWAGGQDPQLARPDEKAGGVDPELDALRTILTQWPEGDKWITVAELLESKRFHREFQEALDSLTTRHPAGDISTKSLGKVLGRLKARVADGRRLRSQMDPSKNTLVWRVERI